MTFFGRCLAGAGVLAALLLIALGLKTAMDPFRRREFNTKAWANNDAEFRASMARDLIANHIKPGTPEQTVRVTLGIPEEELFGATDGGGNQLLGRKTLSYYLGSWPNAGMDDAFLYVHIDGKGEVLFAEVASY